MAKSLPRKSSKALPGLGRSHSRLSVSLLDTEPTEDRSTSHSYSRLSRLRNRSQSQSHPTPEQVSSLIKTYLLPLFDSHPHTSYKKPSLLAVPGTVYGELKLSALLCDQIDGLKKELTLTKQQLQEALQAKEAQIRSLASEQEKLIDLDTNCRLLRFSISQTHRNLQHFDAKTELYPSQILTYQKLYESSETEKKQLVTLLHESKATIDKLKNKSLQLEHGNMLLALENSVIGERLKGLYATLQTVCSGKGNTDKFETEFQIMAENVTKLNDFVEKLIDEMRGLIGKKDELMDMNVTLVNLRNEDHMDKTRLATLTRDKIVQLSNELTSISEQRDSSSSQLEKNEKKLKETLEENQRLRKKMKNSRLKRKATDNSDLICKTCQKMYNEMENFNWSCRTHFGDFGGEMWWCCGKAGRDAPGCKVTKHVSKEDEDEEDSSQKPATTLYCLSCKEIGHRYTECPKDPNIRSKQDLANELKRIQEIKERKKAALLGFESHSMMKALFGNRFGSSGAFGTGEDEENGESDEEIDEKEEWEVILDQRRRENPGSKRDFIRVDSRLGREPTSLRLLERYPSSASEV